MMEKNRINKQAGYSLVEILLVFAITVIILGGIYGFWQFFADTYQFSYNENQALNEAYRTMSLLVRELREVQIGEDGSYPLEQVDDQEIVFYANVDDDNDAERVHYFLDGTDLKKGVVEWNGSSYDLMTEAQKVVASYIDNGTDPLFYYYNGNWPGDVINNPLVLSGRQLATRLIKIDIVIDVSNDDEELVNLSNAVTLRQLKTNQ